MGIWQLGLLQLGLRPVLLERWRPIAIQRIPQQLLEQLLPQLLLEQFLDPKHATIELLVVPNDQLLPDLP